jgi:hypothetical protein
MRRHGGSFIKALADLYMTADRNNKIILEDAFKHYFARYDDMVVEMKKSGGVR